MYIQISIRPFAAQEHLFALSMGFWHNFKFSPFAELLGCKTMKKLAYVLLTIIIVCYAFMFVQVGQAAYIGPVTYLANTTWTRAEGPYQLAGDIIVGSDATLTIEAGTTVNLGNYRIEVWGALNARGNSNLKILFSGTGAANSRIQFAYLNKAWSDSSNSGCIIDNAIINNARVVVEGSSPRISNNYITASNNIAIDISGGSPILTANTISFGASQDAIHITGGSATITSNTIKGVNFYDGINVISPGSATITGNNILNCHEGIEALGVCTITQNNIVDNENDGIRSTNPATVIQNNAIGRNGVGVSGTGGTLGTVQSNTIANNWNTGIWGPVSASNIQNNNIFGNPENMHLTETNVNVTATNNWWGTTNQDEINATIWDFDNAPNLGVVTFVPFLTQANPNAPAIPSTIPVPTPPPTPGPTSTASPTPTTTAHPTPTWTPNPTQQPYGTPTSTPYTEYPTATPYYETPPAPSSTPSEVQEGDEMDLTSIAVISVAVMATLIIVFVLNRTFARGNKAPVQPQQVNKSS